MAFSLGFNLRDWEDMTPCQLLHASIAYADRVKAEQKIAQANNYVLASLIRTVVWGKHMPKYDRIFNEENNGGRKKPMSDEELYKAVCAINAAMGGTVENDA